MTVNTGTYNVDRMLIGGGGYVYRHQTPGSVTGLRIIDNSWWFGPIDNRCSVLGPWEAKIVETDAAVVRGGVPSSDADFGSHRSSATSPATRRSSSEQGADAFHARLAWVSPAPAVARRVHGVRRAHANPRRTTGTTKG